MAFPTAAGSASFSGSYIPTLWAKQHIVYFYQKTFWRDISNTKYVGEIKNYGDKVTVPTLPNFTIRDYVKGQALTYENVAPGTVDFYVDKGKYWAWPVNVVDKKQAAFDFVSDWANHSSKLLAIAIERDILANIYSDAAAANAGGTAGAISGNINLGYTGHYLTVDKDNILDVILRAGQCLDEQNVPDDGRYIILPAWAINALKSSDLKQAYLTGDSVSPLRNGKVGMVDRFTVYMSNLLATTTDTYTVWNVIAGQKEALTFATQLTENQQLDNQNDFGKLYRALQVFGYKVVKPEALVHVYMRSGDSTP